MPIGFQIFGYNLVKLYIYDKKICQYIVDVKFFMLIVNVIYCKNDEQIFVIFQLNYTDVSVVLL